MNKHLIVIIIVNILLITGLLGCTHKEEIIVGKGIIKFNNFEGGFYGIIGDDEKYYDPINLPPEFEEDELRVEYVLRILNDQVSIHQWGVVVEIIEIEKLYKINFKHIFI